MNVIIKLKNCFALFIRTPDKYWKNESGEGVFAYLSLVMTAHNMEQQSLKVLTARQEDDNRKLSVLFQRAMLLSQR